MKTIQAYITSDGVVHTDQNSAISHADKRYGKLVSTIAHELLKIDKYKPMTDFIDENIDLFLALKALKDDMIIDDEA